jgi:hypothetical protein
METTQEGSSPSQPSPRRRSNRVQELLPVIRSPDGRIRRITEGTATPTTEKETGMDDNNKAGDANMVSNEGGSQPGGSSALVDGVSNKITQDPKDTQQAREGGEEEQKMEVDDDDITEKRGNSARKGGRKGNKNKNKNESEKSRRKKFTPPAGYEDIFPIREVVARYTIKVNVPASPQPIVTMLDQLQKMVAKIVEQDKKMVIYPYKRDTHKEVKKRITHPNHMPNDVDGALAFFDKAFPRTDGGDIYVNVLMGTSKTHETIYNNMSYWLREQKHGFFIKRLQAEDSVCAGWLLYSHGQIDAEHLTAAITAETGMMVCASWRMIAVKNKRAKDIPKEEKISALHIDVPKDLLTEDRIDVVARMYSSSNSKGKYPLGIMMRLIPPIQQAANAEVEADMEHARARQAGFQAAIMMERSNGILSMDHQATSIGASLRDMLMSITMKKFDSLPLFHSINKGWQGGYVFHYLPTCKRQASRMIAGLLPYLRWKLKDKPQQVTDMEKWFSPDAIRAAQSAEWNPRKGCVENNADKLMGSWKKEKLVHYEFDLPAELKGKLTLPVTGKKTKKPDDEDATDEGQPLIPPNKDEDSLKSFTKHKNKKQRHNDGDDDDDDDNDDEEEGQKGGDEGDDDDEGDEGKRKPQKEEEDEEESSEGSDGPLERTEEKKEEDDDDEEMEFDESAWGGSASMVSRMSSVESSIVEMRAQMEEHQALVEERFMEQKETLDKIFSLVRQGYMAGGGSHSPAGGPE